MKITVIKQQLKDPQRVSIFVDGKYGFSLSLDELLTQKLKKDQELSETDVKRLKKISDDGKLRARSLEWLLNRPHSIREFKDYLYRKKADPDVTELLVTEFLAKKYLDEQKFATWFTELQKRRGKSNRAIASGLFKKGVNREIVQEILDQGESDDSQQLKILLQKKQKLSRYKNDPKKLATYLVAQGFNWTDVKQALAINSPEK